MFLNKQEFHDFEEEHKYQLLQKIGDGSYGTVYKALNRVTQSTVAIKIIAKSVMRSTQIEESIMSSLQHKNIVRYITKLETKHFFFLVMKLIEQGSLRQLIMERKQLNEQFSDAEVSMAMRSILNAVQYMHEKQILHRDLKPENILIKDKKDLSKLKVADFGLSFQLTQIGGNYQRTLQQQCGTLVFMAPEQLLNNHYSKPVDIWSCGIIMYMLFSMGRHPIAKPNETRETYKESLIRPWIMVDNMPELACDFMRRLTCLNPLERYSAGQALMHPWITRVASDEVPMNCQEMIVIFEKQIMLAQKLKFIFILKFLQRKLDNQLGDLICLQGGYNLQQRNTTEPSSISIFSASSGVSTSVIIETTKNAKYGNNRTKAKIALRTHTIGNIQQFIKERDLKNNTQRTVVSSSSSSPPTNSPKKQVKNFQLRLKEIPTIQELDVQLIMGQPSIEVRSTRLNSVKGSHSMRYHHHSKSSYQSPDQKEPNKQMRSFSPDPNRLLMQKFHEKTHLPPIYRPTIFH